MVSRNAKLVVPLGISAGLLALFLGLLQMALPIRLGGLALLLGVAAWGLTRHQRFPRRSFLLSRPTRERPAPRSSYHRAYRLMAGLMIATMLTGGSFQRAAENRETEVTGRPAEGDQASAVVAEQPRAHSLSPAAQGRTITYTYDDAGRLVRADYGEGRSITYAYDAAGNLVRVRSGGGHLYLPLVLR